MKHCASAALLTELEILYLDNHLLAVVKPAGIATQEDAHNPFALETIAKERLKEKFLKTGNVFLQPIHRIDKPVEGIVLFARTSKALSRLNAQMREKTIQKTYEALTDGYPPAKEATLEHYLIHEEHYARLATPSHPFAKRSVLHYKVLSKQGGRALLQIDLETGRYHQIRAQLAAIGAPILGDKRYGSSQPFLEDAIALSHVKMEFFHPVTKEKIVLSSLRSFAR